MPSSVEPPSRSLENPAISGSLNDEVITGCFSRQGLHNLRLWPGFYLDNNEFVSLMSRQGLHDLRVWPGVSADGNSSSSTPGKGKIENWCGETEGAELTRLASLTKDYRNGNMAKVDWLDRLTFR